MQCYKIRGDVVADVYGKSITFYSKSFISEGTHGRTVRNVRVLLIILCLCGAYDVRILFRLSRPHNYYDPVKSFRAML